MIRSKARLAVELSRLAVFDEPDHLAEQYPMDSEIAADVLWNACLKGDIESKAVADLGCGTGILGIGALLLGAKKVIFLDTDEKAVFILRKNLENVGIHEGFEIIQADVRQFATPVDTVVQNPPFGTRTRHADKAFLEAAFGHARVIYSFHKSTSGAFIKALCEDRQFKVTHSYEFDFPIKASQLFHRRRLKRIKVTCWRMEKADLHHFRQKLL